MAKKFNVTGVCIPELHYMINLSSRLEKIKDMVDHGLYFTINRARQYGKTTTLIALERYLQKDYHVVSMDFQVFDSSKFRNGNIFSMTFARFFLREFIRNPLPADKVLQKEIEQLQEYAAEGSGFELTELFESIMSICAALDKPIVLMIDEIDSAADNQVFLDFLAQLRGYYIQRAKQASFWSVILAGVHDVRNLKRKLRPGEEHKVNSPWNIAADFQVDMSFSEAEIAQMLREYENDFHTGMDIHEMASLLYDCTSGYPYLVSRLCKLLDEEVGRTRKSKSVAWTLNGFIEANRILTAEKNTLFESLIGKVINYPELDRILRDKIFRGQTVAYTAANPVIDLAVMFGIIKNENGSAVPANKVFAKVLSDYYLSLDEIKSLEIYQEALKDKNQFVDNGKLNMRLLIKKFIQHFTDLYGHRGEQFIEKEGRKYFLLYLRPVISGIGHYSMEAVTGSDTRTDLIVYYHEEIFIIETKIWRGEKAHQRGEQQLLGYMEHYHQQEGYLLIFNFNQTKKRGMKEIRINGRTLIEAVV